MPFSAKQEQLRQLLQAQYASLQRTLPSNKQNALLALVHASNRHYLETQQNNTMYHIYPTSLSLHKALSLCFSNGEHIQEGISTDATLDTWADSTLQACSHLAEAEHILTYCDSGFMRMQQGNDAGYNVWIAGKRMPTEWREQEDLMAWTHLLKETYTAELERLYAEKVQIQPQLAAFVSKQELASPLYKTTHTIDDYYFRLGMLHVKCMVAYTMYPPTTHIGGCTFAIYRDVLSALISFVLKQVDIRQLRLLHGMQSPAFLQHNDVLLIEALAETLALDQASVRLALDAYTLDAENVGYHASTNEVPAPPLVHLDEQHRVVSLQGLLTYPLFFLMRELKRKYASDYHTASQLREEVFRQDVYALFADKRFVKSDGSVELRGIKGTLTTDVDALIFDRKTGALALFELKSQDPFAYSLQERTRQRDYFYSAGKQVIASSEWVKRNGANALLSRLDFTQVKRFKAQNVYIFVLGRYLAHFFDGPPLDARAAWGTWSQVLRLTQGKPFGANDSNPIQSLHNKLTKDTPLVLVEKPYTVQEIVIENQYIRVYPSFDMYRNRVE